jgi:hypothetical protein
MNRAHVPTTVVVLVAMVVMLVLYHLAFGRRGRKAPAAGGYYR